jgi:peptide/nickel transport system substrate-binding protein
MIGRISRMLVAFALVVTAAACGGSDDDASGTESNTAATGEAAETTEDNSTTESSEPAASSASEPSNESETAPAGSDSADSSSADTGEEPQIGGELSFGINTDVITWDPTNCGFTIMQCNAVFGSLLLFDSEANEIVPNMAESFDPSSDGLTWTLSLRPGLTFTDGSPYDADAVVANWERHKDPANRSPQAGIAGAMTWEVTDDTTVQVSLDAPNFQLAWALTGGMGMIGSPTSLQQPDAASNPVGAGPFVLDSWSPGTDIEMSKNTGYWDAPRPYLDKLTFRLLPADDLRAEALKTGEIQLNMVFIDQIAAALEGEGFASKSQVPLSGSGARLSTVLPPVSDPELRLALAKLIDAQQIVDTLYPGGQVADTMIPDSFPFANTEPVTAPDLEGAQELINAYLARTGEDSVHVEWSSGATPLQQQLGELIKAQWERAEGVEVTINASDNAALQARVGAGEVQAMQPFIGGANPDQLYELFHSESAGNVWNYSNPEVDAAHEITRTSPDENERNEAYARAADLITLDNHWLPYRRTITYFLYDDESLHGVRVGDNARVFLDGLWFEQ